MTYFGKIHSYDSGKGAGTITPEKGGENLAFVKADLHQEAAEPKAGQRFGYETRQAGDGKAQAINLQQEQGQSAEKQQS
ncbi:hypothetical protein [Sphingopyxis sp. MWB1]|uniref:hypothetical protein n=1 Tax=Sphingopyxis sp. MWB1 TaxID=1537715 RepID=UPI00051A1023|nr:hypothetical protein [Sphingopyxis sp. MWB1]